MPQKVYDADGNELDDFYSPDEVEEEARKKADEITAKKEEEFEADKLEAETEKTELQNQLTEAQAELEKLKDKDTNFENLRKGKEKDKEKHEEEKSKLEDQIKELGEKVDKLSNQPFETAKNTFVTEKFGDNKEAKEKFDYYYGKLSAGAETADEVQKALDSAHDLVVKELDLKQEASPGKDSKVVGVDSTRTGEDTGAGESDDSKGFRKDLGLSDADKDKHGKKDDKEKMDLF